MSHYALAVDIGGTFTDVVLRRCRRPDLGRQDADHAGEPGYRLLPRRRRGPEESRRRAWRRHRRARARDDGRDQCSDRTQGAAHRAARDRRLPRHPRASATSIATRCSIRRSNFPSRWCSREMTFGVAERVLATGEALKPLDVDTGASHGRRAWNASGVVSVAVSFLNAYLNPANERAIARASSTNARRRLYVSISSDVAPQIREYPRTSTAAMNAYTVPITGPISTRLRDGLSSAGSPRPADHAEQRRRHRHRCRRAISRCA